MALAAFVPRAFAASLVLTAFAALCAAPAAAQGRLLPNGADAWQRAGEEGIRGVTVGPIESSLYPGRGYGSESSAALLNHLARLGANWVSVTPFGRIWSLTSTDVRMDFEAPYELNRRNIRRFVDQAHARGIRVLLIPHLWVEMGGWRGDMDPETPEEWEAFLASYRAFVLEWARNAAAAHADAFSIGVECQSFSDRHGRYWSALIRDVRAAFDGYVTYSANWDEADGVIFWDDLDLIGINAFYPLADHHGASYAEYAEGAARAAQNVGELAELLERPVLFVEVGYTTRADAAVEPWLWPDNLTDVYVDEGEQARALRASLSTFLDEPWFAGFLVWRYYADLDDTSQEAEWGFSPHAKQAERVMVEAFRSPYAVEGGAWGWMGSGAPEAPSWVEVIRSLAPWWGSSVARR